jgi:hypothetical protein
MNAWFDDPRTKLAEGKTFEAERAERRGEFGAARALYAEAAELFSKVAISVAPDHPNTRSDLGIAAVACFARSLRFHLAVEFAERLLAEPDGLSPAGKHELEEMAAEYARRQPIERRPARRAMRMRDRVRTAPKVAA